MFFKNTPKNNNTNHKEGDKRDKKKNSNIKNE